MERLILGLVVFFGVHSISLLALDWRNRIAERLGRTAWQVLYSIAALVGFYLLVTGYGAARPSAAVLYVSPSWSRYVAALLMLPVFALALASVLPGRIRDRAGHPLLLFGAFLAWAVAVRLSLARRPARPIRTLPSSAVNDVIVVGGSECHR